MSRGGKKAQVGIGLGMIAVGLGLLLVALALHDLTPTITTSHTSGPVYLTVLPKGKTIAQLGGWQRVSPTDSDPVYAYADSINGVTISVSEQPLPASFKDNIENQVAALAKSYNAADKITASGTTVYIGTSAKGPQSVILTKNDLLILIKSQQVIPNSAWAHYISSLN